MNLSKALDYQIPTRQIDFEYKTQYDKATTALNHWYDTHGQSATIYKLKVALYEVGRPDIAKEIGKALIM